MSGINGDQLHRSTLGIYRSLTDEFNPSLQKLVSLGNSYAHAFKDLVVSSEAYFTALSEIGQKAFYSTSSRSLGDVLIQIADNQRRLALELEGVFRNFSLEVLQVMESSVQLDIDYISHSRATYEREVHKQAAAAQQRQRRGGTGQEYLQFLSESHQEALQEEERRYRFLAEKHCGLVQSIGLLMKKTSGPLLQKADVWTEEVDATRRPEPQRPAAVDNAGGMRAEDIRQIREEMTLGKVPSRAPSPVGSVYRSRGGGGGGGAVSMRAKAAHQPSSSNPTLLPFSRGQIITVKTRQPRNGWLYGYAENGSGQGWFPASYVEELDDPPMSSSSWNYSLRSSSSNTSDLLDQPGGSSSRTSSAMSSVFDLPKPSSSSSSSSSRSGAPPPPPPPPAQSSSKSQSERSQNELFPRGTNPFATVKLKPTRTNDRSAPILYRK
ncbi:brain-specific angiogenesis inhibitor 1-associated protein 2-like protein 2 [Gambusia affinis]|uniref:brain-specific angiogenesis inhibitor 1-associated protein 2-like protein 2 n=1 Tax=Gambusia affinis TaxID=33528 RepID=UPI001CDB66D3|nr:brain-specific angiogenesis inhibitor 1-associated protein 2-like protein 2 [Gambusia affinis]